MRQNIIKYYQNIIKILSNNIKIISKYYQDLASSLLAGSRRAHLLETNDKVACRGCIYSLPPFYCLPMHHHPICVLCASPLPPICDQSFAQFAKNLCASVDVCVSLLSFSAMLPHKYSTCGVTIHSVFFLDNNPSIVQYFSTYL